MRAHLAVTLMVTCVTAWFSYAYFHIDEYFQVLELTRSKLDPASVPVFPWEHTQRLRPWLQPLIYWLFGRIARAFGGLDPFQDAFVFRLLTGRRPAAKELGVLRRLLEEQRASFQSNREAGEALSRVGDSAVDKTVDPVETAAFAALANAVMNFDEAMVKR